MGRRKSYREGRAKPIQCGEFEDLQAIHRRASLLASWSIASGSLAKACAKNARKSDVVLYTIIVYTIFVRQNITFNADKSDIELAREEAQSQNTTLHELFRDWLKVIVGRIRARKYRALMNKLRYADAGRKFTRDEMNER
jgi:hypothetical protein